MNKVLKNILAAVLLGSCVAVQAMTPIQNNKAQLNTEAELNGYTKTYPVVVVFVSSDLCSYCQMVKPLVDQLTREMKHVMFVYVDYNNKSLEALGNRLAPQGVPELKIYKNGRIVDQIGGAQSKQAIQSLISRYAPAPAQQVAQPRVVASQPVRLQPTRVRPVTTQSRVVRYAPAGSLRSDLTELEAANADLASANADLDLANADLDVANADLGVANADLDVANAELESANADVEAANAEAEAGE